MARGMTAGGAIRRSQRDRPDVRPGGPRRDRRDAPTAGPLRPIEEMDGIVRRWNPPSAPPASATCAGAAAAWSTRATWSTTRMPTASTASTSTAMPSAEGSPWRALAVGAAILFALLACRVAGIPPGAIWP